MVAEKTMRFEGKGRDLDALSDEIVERLESQGFKTQKNTPADDIVIQATKSSIPRALISADRAFTILLSGEPDDFTIKIGIGKLVQNLGVAAAETILLSPLFLAVDVPEVLWTKHVEDGIAKDISDIANAADEPEKSKRMQTNAVRKNSGGKRQ